MTSGCFSGVFWLAGRVKSPALIAAITISEAARSKMSDIGTSSVGKGDL